MQFSASAEDMKRCIGIAVQTIDKEGIGACAKITAGKGVTICTAGNHSGTLVKLPEHVVKTPGSVFVDALKFQSIIGMCDTDVDFSFKDNHLELKNGQRQYKLLTVKESAGFNFKEQSKLSSYVVPVKELYESVRLSLPAAKAIYVQDSKGITLQQEGAKELRISAAERNAAAGNTTVIKVKSAEKEVPTVIAGLDFCKHITSLDAGKDEAVTIGISKNTISVFSKLGYSYFAQLVGKPIDAAVMLEKLKATGKPVLTLAGQLVRGLRSVLVVAADDEDDGNSGHILGTKGKLVLTAHNNMTGKGRDTVLTAGDLEIDSWYNLRNLRDYLSKVDPDCEVSLSVIKNKGHCALVVRHGDSVYWLVNREAPHADKAKEAK